MSMKAKLMPRLGLSALIGAAALLAACGVRGPLTPAAPLFGEDRARWEAEQTAKAAEAEKAKAEAAEGERQTLEIPVTPPPVQPPQ